MPQDDSRRWLVVKLIEIYKGDGGHFDKIYLLKIEKSFAFEKVPFAPNREAESSSFATFFSAKMLNLQGCIPTPTWIVPTLGSYLEKFLVDWATYNLTTDYWSTMSRQVYFNFSCWTTATLMWFLQCGNHCYLQKRVGSQFFIWCVRWCERKGAILRGISNLFIIGSDLEHILGQILERKKIRGVFIFFKVRWFNYD